MSVEQEARELLRAELWKDGYGLANNHPDMPGSRDLMIEAAVRAAAAALLRSSASRDEVLEEGAAKMDAIKMPTCGRIIRGMKSGALHGEG